MSTKKHEVPEELLSGLLADYKKPEDLIGENGLLKQLTKLLVERALDAELTEHLGYDQPRPRRPRHPFAAGLIPRIAAGCGPPRSMERHQSCRSLGFTTLLVQESLQTQ